MNWIRVSDVHGDEATVVDAKSKSSVFLRSEQHGGGALELTWFDEAGVSLFTHFCSFEFPCFGPTTIGRRL